MEKIIEFFDKKTQVASRSPMILTWLFASENDLDLGNPKTIGIIVSFVSQEYARIT